MDNTKGKFHTVVLQGRWSSKTVIVNDRFQCDFVKKYNLVELGGTDKVSHEEWSKHSLVSTKSICTHMAHCHNLVK